MPTPRFGLPFIVQGQAQKEVTHNDALVRLDALIDLYILDRDLTAPPGSPTDGDAYIVAASPTGAWDGQAGNIAYVIDGGWRFHVPVKGMVAYVADEQKMIVFIASGWVDLVSLLALQNISKLGILTAADTTNRLAVKSDAILFSHDDVTPGTGDLRVTLNKSAAAKDAGFVFQDGFGTRALFGLLGDDDFTLKVSPDGSNFIEALSADRSTGIVTVAQGLAHGASGKPLSGLIFTPGGDGTISFYRNDTSRTQNPRTATIGGVAGDVLTLTTNDSSLFFWPTMENVSYARIWNTSKVPEQSAWIKRMPAANQLQVLDAADISTWGAGETVQIGDPLSVTATRAIALDISPMLQNILGTVFRQTGLVCKSGLAASAIASKLDVAPSGVTGSNVVAVRNADSVNVWNGIAFVPCSELSPISNSNLVFVTETSTGTLGITLLNSIAVFA